MNQRYSKKKFILKAVKPFKWFLFSQSLVATTWAITNSLEPYILKWLLNTALDIKDHRYIEALIMPAVYLMCLSIYNATSFRIHDLIWLNVKPKLKKDLTKGMMERMFQHSHQLFQVNFTGSLSNRIKDVGFHVPRMLETIIDRFYSDILAIIICVIALSFVSAEFAIGLVIWIILFVLISSFPYTRIEKLSSKAANTNTKLRGYIVDVISNISNVRLFSARKRETAKLVTILDKTVKTEKMRDWRMLQLYALQGISFLIYEGICFYLLIVGFEKGVVTAGDFVLVISINLSILKILWNFSEDVGKFSEALGNVSQGLKIALSPLEITDIEGAKPLKLTTTTIEYKDIKFHYKGSKPLFKNLNVTIPSSQKVGLVGYSGSGKTTFVNILLRIFNINKGKILIDNQDISKVTQDSLREVISTIPQDPYLFHRSIMENIRYGKQKATEKEIIEAARKANAHEFINLLPEKYNSLVGERGVKLSGGQRQRIAIARAILKNAPILVLDEATSQLDSITENKIQKSINTLMENKTTIIIAHRLSTLLSMDRIIVFDKGKIVEDGPHKKLLQNKGLYHSLWSEQIGGLLPSDRII